jgi:hypothetical protein
MSFRGGVGVVPRRTHLRARLSLWCRPHRYIPHSANARAPWGLLRGGVGWTNAGRAMGGALPIVRTPQSSTATACDYQRGCIVHRRDRGEVPGRRARWPAQCGAGDGETGGMWGGRVRWCRCASGCEVHGAECTAAYTKRCVCVLPSAVDGVGGAYGNATVSDETVRAADVRGGERALSWTVGMPGCGDVWATSNGPGETSMGGWDGRVARDWARALGVVVEAVEVRLRARPQLPQRGNISSPVRMHVGRRIRENHANGTVSKTSRRSVSE